VHNISGSGFIKRHIFFPRIALIKCKIVFFIKKVGTLLGKMFVITRCISLQKIGMIIIKYDIALASNMVIWVENQVK
jgi:hypothetical protein